MKARAAACAGYPPSVALGRLSGLQPVEAQATAANDCRQRDTVARAMNAALRPGHPIAFPHFSQVLQSLRQCSSTGYAPTDDDCSPTDDDPTTAAMSAIKGAAINPRIFNPP
jgi:hypothetical protein